MVIHLFSHSTLIPAASVEVLPPSAMWDDYVAAYLQSVFVSVILCSKERPVLWPEQLLVSRSQFWSWGCGWRGAEGVSIRLHVVFLIDVSRDGEKPVNIHAFCGTRSMNDPGHNDKMIEVF